MLVKFEAVKKQRAINYITLFCSLCVRHTQIVKKGQVLLTLFLYCLDILVKPKQVKKVILNCILGFSLDSIKLLLVLI